MVEVHLYLIMFATAGMLNIYIYIFKYRVEWGSATEKHSKESAARRANPNIRQLSLVLWLLVHG